MNASSRDKRGSKDNRRFLLPALLLSLAVHGLLILGGVYFSESEPFRSVAKPSVELACILADEAPRPTRARPGPALRIPGPSVREVRLVEDPPPAVYSPSPGGSTTMFTSDSRDRNMGTSGKALGTMEKGPGKPSGGHRPPFFPAVTAGQSVVYLLDHSLSMGWRNCLVQARAELLRSLEELPSSSSFQVLVFNRQVDLLLPASRNRWLQPDRNTVERVREALLSLAPSDGTQLCQAMKEALVWRPQHIILVTDSDDLNAKEIADLTRFNAGRTTIHVVDLRWRPGQPGSLALQQLSLSNRGSYRHVGE